MSTCKPPPSLWKETAGADAAHARCPGAGRVLAAIDANGDGVISAAEQQAYAEQVRRDLSLTVMGCRLILRLVSSMFPKLEADEGGYRRYPAEL